MRKINQRELRNNSGEIMRGLDRGESFLITRNGVVVGQLTPAPRRRFVRTDYVLTLFENAHPVDFTRFRKDVDGFVDQNPEPHE
jgi:antitoxin (DNA-binding transcriptional repressor) of toxin-antitoxin stability system